MRQPSNPHHLKLQNIVATDQNADKVKNIPAELFRVGLRPSLWFISSSAPFFISSTAMSAEDSPAATGSASAVKPKVGGTESTPSSAQGKSPNTKSGNAKENAKPTPDAGKLSAAELKKKAKEEKAARRAAAVQSKATAENPTPATVAPGQKSESAKGGKSQPKKGAEVRNLPVRGGPTKSAPVVEVPKVEDKTVDLFRHLYKPRTTTIAEANKDVHPAVLALGLQMSNYTICGSCARLVATLQAFKRVSLFLRIEFICASTFSSPLPL